MTRDITRLSFQNIEEALTTVNAQDQGRYFLCTCPECKGDEAFIYKNNPNFLICNRENNCGTTIVFEYEEKKQVNEWKSKKLKEDNIQMSPERAQERELITRLFKHIQVNCENENLNNYRGMSRKTTEAFALDLVSEQYVKSVFRKAPNIFYSQKLFKRFSKKINYAEAPHMASRNIIFPIYGDDGQLDRILLRTTLDKNPNKKEIQLQINPSPSARDFFKDIPEDATHIVIGEAPIDAYSFREIDENVGVYAMTGSRKVNRLMEDIRKHKEVLKDKVFIIATDNDKAGHEAKNKLTDMLLREQLICVPFEYEGDINDVNEFLVEDRSLFQKTYERIKKTSWLDMIRHAPKLDHPLYIKHLFKSKEGITDIRFQYEGLVIRNVKVDTRNNELVVPAPENIEISRPLKNVLSYIANKAPDNKEFRDILVPSADNCLNEAGFTVLSLEKKSDLITKINLEVGEVKIKGIEIHTLKDGSEPMFFYPTGISTIKEFDNVLLDKIKQYQIVQRRQNIKQEEKERG